jgi:hypothetical protein
MRSLYLTAETKIINEIVRKNQQGYVDYAEQAALERIQVILQGMIDESWEYVPKMVKLQFRTANLTPQGYANARALTVPQTMIVEQLIQNLMGEIIDSSTTAYNTSKMLYEVARLNNDVYRQTALLATAYNEAAGYGFMHGSETLEQMLNAKGITSFTDKAGRHWSLTDYCTMTSRTTARQAQVAAVLTKDEHDLYQIVKIGSTCPLCAVYEGRVYSKSGTDPHYPPLARAFGKIDPAGSDDLSNTFLNIHPNCLHSLIKFTEVGKTDKQINKIREFSSFETNPADHDPRTKKQIEAYRNKERNRAKLLSDIRQKNEYRDVLGSIIPQDIQRFRDLKKSDKWSEIKSEYRKAINAMKETAASKVPVNKNGNPIEFDMPYKDFGDEGRNKRYAQRVDSAKQLLTNLANEYQTELTSIKIAGKGKGKGTRGAVDLTGVMELGNLSPTTTVHEFAHSIAMSNKVKYGLSDEKTKEFFEELKKIRRQYTAAWQKGQAKEISGYAREDIDEFFAEAFMHAKIKQLGIELPKSEAEALGDDYTYSDKVLALVDKFFKK